MHPPLIAARIENLVVDACIGGIVALGVSLIEAACRIHALHTLPAGTRRPSPRVLHQGGKRCVKRLAPIDDSRRANRLSAPPTLLIAAASPVPPDSRTRPL